MPGNNIILWNYDVSSVIYILGSHVSSMKKGELPMNRYNLVPFNFSITIAFSGIIR